MEEEAGSELSHHGIPLKGVVHPSSSYSFAILHFPFPPDLHPVIV